MPDTVRVKRTTSGNPPEALAFGELAFSDANNRLYIGKNSGAIHTINTNGDGQGGADGFSAYELAVQSGFVGTLEDWLDSLQGPPGADGAQGPPGADGAQGPPGADGAQGPPGLIHLATRLIEADYTIIQNDGTAFFLVNPAASPVIQLPITPLNFSPFLNNSYFFEILRGTGAVTIDFQGNLVNGVSRNLTILPSKQIRLVWLGGQIGWYTDLSFTNLALNKPVYSVGLWAVPPIALEAAVDGNSNTATGYGHTSVSYDGHGLIYADLGESKELTYLKISGFWGWPNSSVWSAGGERDIGLFWSTADPQNFLNSGSQQLTRVTQVSQGIVNSYSFTKTVVPFTARYVGVRAVNVSSPSVGFNVTEIEVS